MDLRDYVRIGLRFEIAQLEYYRRAIKRYTEGELYIRRRGNDRNELYIKRKDGMQEYVKRENAKEAISIIKHNRAETAIEILEKSIKARQKLIKAYEPFSDEHLDEVMKEQYQRKVLEKLGAKDGKIRKYDGRLAICTTPSDNPFERNAICHQTKFGLYVRSRIEVLIAEALYDAGIIFRYEEELKLYDDKGHSLIRYPDFTIHCADGRRIYWEHAGMYEDEEYARRHEEKMRLYFLNGIYEPVNLIVTMENRSHEIDMESIWRVINGMILPVA